jgi:hypothetical protein
MSQAQLSQAIRGRKKKRTEEDEDDDVDDGASSQKKGKKTGGTEILHDKQVRLNIHTSLTSTRKWTNWLEI